MTALTRAMEENVRTVMYTKAMPFIIITLFAAGILAADTLDVPGRPASGTATEDTHLSPGYPGESPFSVPLDYSGTLNILLNQDNTQQLQNEQQIVTNPVDPNNLCAVWRDFRLGYRRVAYSASFDGGITWTEGLFEEPTYPWHSDPGLTVDAEGNFFAVILSYTSTYEPNGLFVYRSSDGGLSWGDPVTVINGVPNVFEDKELIACDRTGGVHDGNLYVTWARFGYDTDILLARSTDGGQSFESPVEVSDFSGVQWPVPVVAADGSVLVAWVSYTPGSIKLDRSTDGGATFGTDATVASPSFVYGYINGGITVFSFPAMDADITGGPHHGNIYVAYMDYGTGFDTDIFLKRSTNNGGSWSQPVRLNDDSAGNGRDQFHPWITIDETGLVTVIFLDRRNDPNNYLYDCYMTQSSDGGVSWTENIRISDVSSDPQAGSALAGLLGEYIGVTSSYGRVNALWTDTRRGHQDAFTARVYTMPDVDLKAVPAGTEFGPGDDLEYTLYVTNEAGSEISFWGAGFVTTPWGEPFGFGPVDGPALVTLPPFADGQITVTRQLPPGIPDGRYYYTIRGGQLPDVVIDEDTFHFTVEAP